jgi:MFS-type transporter involved in bile tolerance (Atg22 family)
MKRAALLILVVGAPLVLLLFPELRRRIASKLRFLLLLWAGAVLFVGLFAGRGKNFLEGAETLEIGLALLGLALFVGAFLSVLRDSSR